MTWQIVRSLPIARLGPASTLLVLLLTAPTRAQTAPAPDQPPPTPAQTAPMPDQLPPTPAQTAPMPGQVPEAVVPDVLKRDGLFTRMIPPQHTLPPDKKRDYYYNTRWDDDPYFHGFYNFCHGGLYGWPWKQKCSMSIYPYFHGAPGTSTLSECCRPMHPLMRLPINLVHPFRPVGMYYDGGSYTPIYSLDPLVPGPGSYPWPHYLKRCLGG